MCESAAVAALTSSAFVWAQSTPAAGVNPFAADVNQRRFTVTGTVVSVGSGSLVVKIDEHGHPIPFSLGPVAPAELPARGDPGRLNGPGLATGSSP